MAQYLTEKQQELRSRIQRGRSNKSGTETATMSLGKKKRATLVQVSSEPHDQSVKNVFDEMAIELKGDHPEDRAFDAAVAVAKRHGEYTDDDAPGQESVCGICAKPADMKQDLMSCFTKQRGIYCCKKWWHPKCLGRSSLPPDDQDWMCQVCTNSQLFPLRLNKAVGNLGYCVGTEVGVSENQQKPRATSSKKKQNATSLDEDSITDKEADNRVQEEAPTKKPKARNIPRKKLQLSSEKKSQSNHKKKQPTPTPSDDESSEDDTLSVEEINNMKRQSKRRQTEIPNYSESFDGNGDGDESTCLTDDGHTSDADDEVSEYNETDHREAEDDDEDYGGNSNDEKEDLEGEDEEEDLDGEDDTGDENKNQSGARKAGEAPETARQQMDHLTRVKLRAIRKNVAQLQSQSIPITRSDKYDPTQTKHCKLRVQEQHYPHVAHGAACVTTQAPNLCGTGPARYREKPALLLWVGSQAMKDFVESMFQEENNGQGLQHVELMINTNYEDYEANFISKKNEKCRKKTGKNKRRKSASAKRKGTETESNESKKNKRRRKN